MASTGLTNRFEALSLPWKLFPIMAVVGGFLAAMLGIDQQLFDGRLTRLLSPAADALIDAVAGATALDTLLLLVAVVLAILLALAMRSRLRWQAWCGHFRYAGPARELDPALVGDRRMDVPFIELTRPAEEPSLFVLGGQQTGDGPKVLAADAWAFLEDWLRRASPPGGQWGVLLSGKDYSGKTRLVCEVLRAFDEEVLLLVPDSAGAVPMLEPIIGKKQRVVIFFDDLDKFRDTILVWYAFMRSLAQAGSLYGVLATVRTLNLREVEGEARDAFREVRQKLVPAALPVLTEEQHNEVMQHLSPVLRDMQPDSMGASEAAEPTFAFVEGTEFREARTRFHECLDPDARRLLCAAELLDRCGIVPRHKRWLAVAVDLFGFPGAEKFGDGLKTLGVHGFLEGELPAAGYLRHVARGNCVLPGAEERLMGVLEERKDFHAFKAWAGASYEDRRLSGMRVRLLKAIEHGKGSNLPEGQVVAAEALLDLQLPLLVQKKPDVEGAKGAICEAIECGIASNLPEGQVVAARASLRLGRMLLAQDESNMEGALRAYREAIEYGTASNLPEGQVVAARTLFNVGINLLAQDEPNVARWAYREAIEYGKASNLPEGKGVAALASSHLGMTLLLQKKPDVEGAEQAYREAIQHTKASNLLEGEVVAAWVSFSHWQALRHLPEGQVAAAEAWFNLGVTLLQQEKPDVEGAKRAYSTAIQIAKSIEGPRGERVLRRSREVLDAVTDNKD